jgi:tetratricopeptide (TPR) repeat protein
MTPFRILCVMFVLLATGCGSWDPTKGISAKGHANAGAAFESQGLWRQARDEFEAATRDLEKDVPGGPLYAVVYYEYGRCLGVTGRFDEAEVWLKRALDRDRKRKGPFYLDLTELARLNFDQGKFAEAISYFEPLVQELDRIGAPTQTPAAYSDILREYAEALTKIGRIDEAKKKMEIVAELKEKFPMQKSITDRTPYGKFTS